MNSSNIQAILIATAVIAVPVIVISSRLIYLLFAIFLPWYLAAMTAVLMALMSGIFTGIYLIAADDDFLRGRPLKWPFYLKDG